MARACLFARITPALARGPGAGEKAAAGTFGRVILMAYYRHHLALSKRGGGRGVGNVEARQGSCIVRASAKNSRRACLAYCSLLAFVAGVNAGLIAAALLSEKAIIFNVAMSAWPLRLVRAAHHVAIMSVAFKNSSRSVAENRSAALLIIVKMAYNIGAGGDCIVWLAPLIAAWRA